MAIVSVVIVVYNTGEPLRTCLESVLSQSYSELEVIVVDDGSQDPATIELLHAYTTQDSRIQLLRHEQYSGLSCSRNAGVAKASGKYLTFLNAGDQLAPNFIERMVEALERNQTELAMCQIKNQALEPVAGTDVEKSQAETEVSTASPLPAKEQGDMQFLISSMQLFSLPVEAYGKVMRLDSYLQAQMNFNDSLTLGAEAEWTYRCVVKFKSFSMLDMVGVYHMLRPDEQNHSLTKREVHQLFAALWLCYVSFRESGLIATYYESFLEFLLTTSFSYLHHIQDHRLLKQLVVETIKLAQRCGYNLSEDLELLAQNMRRCKIRYRACRLVFYRLGFQDFKLRYEAYKHIYDFLQEQGLQLTQAATNEGAGA